ncbi:hypothetical protein BDV96DRAFT_199220 [Lophiotrema nucula]|uniref:Uncharacterized protein n=1 Tax=Lophiotrema nucula TaxID=690887 RepID=A0A6A5YXC5_9PLEO|nr:hypothetical protein BDV96DRAFT_199220 [Lophiotrema nucula]
MHHGRRRRHIIVMRLTPVSPLQLIPISCYIGDAAYGVCIRVVGVSYAVMLDASVPNSVRIPLAPSSAFRDQASYSSPGSRKSPRSVYAGWIVCIPNADLVSLAPHAVSVPSVSAIPPMGSSAFPYSVKAAAGARSHLVVRLKRLFTSHPCAHVAQPRTLTLCSSRNAYNPLLVFYSRRLYRLPTGHLHHCCSRRRCYLWATHPHGRPSLTALC